MYCVSVNRPAACSWSSPEPSRFSSISCTAGTEPDACAESWRSRVGKSRWSDLGDRLRLIEPGRRRGEGPFVAPEPEKLATERQQGPEVDARADVLLPASLEHQCRVKHHQDDREPQRQAEDRQRSEIGQPRRPATRPLSGNFTIARRRHGPPPSSGPLRTRAGRFRVFDPTRISITLSIDQPAPDS